MSGGEQPANPVSAALRDWPQANEDGDYIVVPTHCMYPSNGVVSVTVEGGADTFRVHDVPIRPITVAAVRRRSVHAAGSAASAALASAAIRRVERALGRAVAADLGIGIDTSSVTGIYDRHEYLAEKRQALDAWGRYLESLLSPPGGNVVPFPAVAVAG